jgi:hypothetical protein
MESCKVAETDGLAYIGSDENQEGDVAQRHRSKNAQTQKRKNARAKQISSRKSTLASIMTKDNSKWNLSSSSP